MISIASIYLSPSPLPYLKLRLTKSPSILSTPIPNIKPYEKRIRNGICRAELGIDAPFSIAIGACILSSLVLPVTDSSDDDENDAVLDSTDTRLSVMSIISFIPYFNWLSWVFAWLDSGKRIYAVYAIVYLAPYLRSNLSLSPEESWLPIASIVLCIIHVQIEVSIKNGDIQGFQIFREASKQISSMTKGREYSKGSQEPSKERRKKENMNLPSAEEQSRDEIRRWEDSKETLDDDEKWNGERDDEGRRKR